MLKTLAVDLMVTLAYGAVGIVLMAFGYLLVDLATPGITERVAADLGYGRRDARLVLSVEAEQRRDLARTLPSDHHVLFVLDRDGEEGSGHAGTAAVSALRITTTVKSSRPRS